jgi:hypothetical protein
MTSELDTLAAYFMPKVNATKSGQPFYDASVNGAQGYCQNLNTAT